MSTADLRALAERAKLRDPDAWEVIYRQVHPGLYAYARRRLATEEQAEDAVSETMTRAIDAAQSWASGPAPCAWPSPGPWVACGS